VERGKCFIEYIPAENAWIPIEADGYMYIDCLWVSGSFKRHGYSTDLLAACIEDSKEKGKKGLCILCAAKKKPFLADPKFLKYKGFTVADEADNGIQLWYLPFEENASARSTGARQAMPEAERQAFNTSMGFSMPNMGAVGGMAY
jgi:N-acetylglutamate synthase-like GNAT family acetyltransferase